MRWRPLEPPRAPGRGRRSRRRPIPRVGVDPQEAPGSTIAPTPLASVPRKKVSDLNQYPLHLIQRHLIIAPVIQPGGARRFVIGHALRNLELAAVTQVLGDAGGTERVIANLRRMPAASARRRIIRYTSAWERGFWVAHPYEPAYCETTSLSARPRHQPRRCTR